jgi:O-antigen/teichoic acid export membrane protein
MLSNFLTLGTGEVVARTLYVIAFVWLARTVGTEALGEFGFALTVGSYLALFVQQGIDQVAVREVSRSPEKLGSYLRPILGLRLLAASGGFVLLLGYAKFAHFTPRGSALIAFAGLTCFSTALSARWVFQAQGKARHLAIASIVAQLVFILGVLLVRGPSDVYWAAGAQVIGEWLAAFYLWAQLRPRSIGRPEWSQGFNRDLLRESWPVSVSLFLGNVLYNFDVLALGWLAGPAEVGLYLAVYRCATVFSPILSMLQVSILPQFSRTYLDKDTLWQMARGVMVPTFAICAALAVFFTIFATPVLKLVYGTQFLQGAPLLRLLCWSLPFQGLRSVLRQVLIASHLQKRDTWNMGLAALTSVCLDLLLVPRFGAYACAVATVLAEIVLFAASFQASWRATRGSS